mmetsp:Transcript_80024/g.141210  ORF Transcript_80024/g.141210 Transcript_80024/m.141210 type:complete len:365 (+) Transcript_80024:55-1149(+)
MGASCMVKACRVDAINELVLMTLNLQYFSSYPKGAEGIAQAQQKLLTATSGPNPPDVICVQEGLQGRDILSTVGYDLAICSGEEGVAQSVCDMVYGDVPTLAACEPETHQMLLCNQVYVRKGSRWTVADKGAMQISSDLQLAGSSGRAQGKLAVRSMVWVKLSGEAFEGPAVYVMCTHISGGRFEDSYFVQQLANERQKQPARIMTFFEEHRSPGDAGILVGDFNSTGDYDFIGGAMHAYFKAAIANSPGVKADAAAASLDENKLEELFKDYMVSPFMAILGHEWSFAYGKEVGITSGFGHLIDHMAMSGPLQVLEAEVIYLTNQKFSNQQDTDLVLTDHNSIKTRFSVGQKLWQAEACQPNRR